MQTILSITRSETQRGLRGSRLLICSSFIVCFHSLQTVAAFFTPDISGLLLLFLVDGHLLLSNNS